MAYLIPVFLRICITVGTVNENTDTQQSVAAIAFSSKLVCNRDKVNKLCISGKKRKNLT